MKEIKDLWRGGEKVQRIIREQRANRSPGRATGAPGLNCLVLGGGGAPGYFFFEGIVLLQGHGSAAGFDEPDQVPAFPAAVGHGVRAAGVEAAAVGQVDGIGDFSPGIHVLPVAFGFRPRHRGQQQLRIRMAGRFDEAFRRSDFRGPNARGPGCPGAPGRSIAAPGAAS